MKDKRELRLPALRRFGAAITFLNIIGRAFLGFESSWAQLLVAAGTAYALELALEAIDARSNRRKPQFVGGGARAFVDFILPAHITAMACSMLIYANDRLFPFGFAAGVGIASKAVFRVRSGGGDRHVLNPSNTGIACVLLVFPWVGVAQPYQFTENVSGPWDWAIPGIIICLGTFLNARFTGRLPLIAAWLGAFSLQAVLRGLWFGTPLAPSLAPMTGVAFLLFTFYMVSDPATTPAARPRQVLFGAGVATAYGVLQAVHVVFGLFFALFIVCILRGAVLYRAARLVVVAHPTSPPVPVALTNNEESDR